MYLLHDTRLSGNAWKVRILLALLSIPFERKTHVLSEGTTRSPDYLEMNPLGKVPVLVLPTGEVLHESGAILWYLAQGTSFLPVGIEQTRVLQWMFFEQSEAMKPLASARFWISLAKKAEEKASDIAAWHKAGATALAVLDKQLSAGPFLVGDQMSIADIANFPYVSMAGEGGFDLRLYPSIEAWIVRVRSHPRFVELLD